MIIGLCVYPLFCLCWISILAFFCFVFLGFFLVSLSSLVFWPKFLRVLVTSMSSGSVMCCLYGLGDLRPLDLPLFLVKEKSSFEVVGQDMGPRERGAV